jgi:hypothetical protein
MALEVAIIVGYDLAFTVTPHLLAVHVSTYRAIMPTNTTIPEECLEESSVLRDLVQVLLPSEG